MTGKYSTTELHLSSVSKFLRKRTYHLKRDASNNWVVYRNTYCYLTSKRLTKKGEKFKSIMIYTILIYPQNIHSDDDNYMGRNVDR